MELHLVDAAAISIVSSQERRIPIDKRTKLQWSLSRYSAEFGELLEAPVASFAFHGFAKHAVLLEQVVVLEGRDLVQNFMGSAPRLNDGHRNP